MEHSIDHIIYSQKYAREQTLLHITSLNLREIELQVYVTHYDHRLSWPLTVQKVGI